MSSLYLSVYLSIPLSVHLSIYFIYLSAHLSLVLSPSMYLSVYIVCIFCLSLSIYLFVSPFVSLLSIYRSVCSILLVFLICTVRVLSPVFMEIESKKMIYIYIYIYINIGNTIDCPAYHLRDMTYDR